MPIAGQTRGVARKSIGGNLAGPRFFTLTTSSSACDATSVIDAVNLAGFGNDDFNGWWLRSTSGCNVGETRRVTDHAGATGDLTTPAFSNTVAAADTFELWPPEFNPDQVDRAINDAIIGAYGRGYAPLECQGLHTGGNQYRFSLPSTYSYLQRILVRTSVKSESLHSMEATFDETTDADFTQAVDTENQRTGSGCLKITVAAAASANDLLTDSLSSTDFSWGTHLEFWAKSNVTIAAGAIQVLIDDTAACASPLETLNVPALTADTWTFCRVALTAPEALTAIISVGLKFVTDTGAQVIYFDDMRIVDENTAIWEPFHPNAWGVDKANRGFYFKHDDIPYGLLRLVGGQEPQKLTGDCCTLPIDDEYIINKATALVFAQSGLERYKDQITQWEARAEAARRSVSRPAFARFLR